MKKVSLSFVFLLCLTAISHVARAQQTFQNPVITASLPDPSIIRAADGYYYLVATEDDHNVPVYRSHNLVDWRKTGTAFRDDTRPTFLQDGSIWAPDINRIGDRYVLYYSLSKWGEGKANGIGVATAERPEGPYTDQGKLFTSSEIGVDNSIDPFFIADEGRNYLFWGSFHDIYGVELTEDGLAIKEGCTVKLKSIYVLPVIVPNSSHILPSILVSAFW